MPRPVQVSSLSDSANRTDGMAGFLRFSIRSVAVFSRARRCAAQFGTFREMFSDYSFVASVSKFKWTQLSRANTPQIGGLLAFLGSILSGLKRFETVSRGRLPQEAMSLLSQVKRQRKFSRLGEPQVGTA